MQPHLLCTQCLWMISLGLHRAEPPVFQRGQNLTDTIIIQDVNTNINLHVNVNIDKNFNVNVNKDLQVSVNKKANANVIAHGNKFCK